VDAKSLDDIARFSKKELQALHGMGPKAIRIIGHALHERGVDFAGEES